MRCFIAPGTLKYARPVDERCGQCGGRCQNGKPFLATEPSEILQDQQAKATQQMHGQKEHQQRFGEFHQRAVAPAQK
jgi:hypothetical protein